MFMANVIVSFLNSISTVWSALISDPIKSITSIDCDLPLLLNVLWSNTFNYYYD